MPRFDLTEFRRAVAENRYVISVHAQQRMGQRKVTHADIKHVVTEGRMIEEHPDNLPDPKASS